VIDPSLSGTPSLVYSTYLGGSVDDWGEGNAVAVDSSHMAYVAGSTAATDFPVTPGAYQTKLNQGAPTGNRDAFVAKLNPNASGAASLIYATYLGGSSTDEAAGIAVDTLGNAYVTGGTGENATVPFPTTPGAVEPTYPGFDTAGFVTKLNAFGNGLIYSTFMGSGTSRAIAADAAGNAYITGHYIGGSLTHFVTPTPDAAQPNYGGGKSDGFVTKLDPSGALIYASFLGGSSFEDSLGIAIDATGDAYVTGYTASADFPVSPSAYQPNIHPGGVNGPEDAFVTKFPLSATGALSIKGILPATGGNAGTVTATIIGSGFHLGATVKLVRAGKADINGGSVTVGSEGRTIRATFDLTASPPGTCDLIVTNPDGTTANLISAFTVVQGGAAHVWVDIVGPSVFRIGSTQTIQNYGIAYGNSGTIDSGPVTISSSFPSYLSGTLTFAPGPTSSDITDEGDSLVTSDVQSVPVGVAGFLTLQLVLPNSSSVHPHETFELKAWSDPIPSNAALSASVLSESASSSSNPCLVPTSTGQLCTKLDASTNECRNRALLASANILVNNCPCDPGCPTFDCSTLMPIGTCSGCKCSLCTNVGGMDLRGIIYLLSLAFQLPGSPTNPIRITGGNEKDEHCPGTGGCSHPRGFKVDLSFSSPGLTDYITGPPPPTPPRFTKLPCTRGKAQDQQWKDEKNNVVFTQETSKHHWDLTFFGSGDPCGNGTKCGQANTELVELVAAGDPNDKAGSTGAGTERFLSDQQPLRYTIFFENQPTATAAAQTIVVTDPLDKNVVDLSTLSLGPIVFGNTIVTPPPAVAQFATNVDLRPGQNLIVKVSASLNALNGVLTWRFTSIDPATGLPTTDPSAGFLPPNTNPPQGQASFFFTVMPKKNLATGTLIDNQATVVFDQNSPIATAAWLNTLDNTPPVSQMSSLPPSEPAIFTLQWSGTDVGSGIKSFTIYSSDNGGPFTQFATDTTLTSAPFFGQLGHTYDFYSIAQDAAGNFELPKILPEASTKVTGGPPIAKCQNVTVPTDPGVCTASSASVNNGSSDPDGDTVTVSQTPPGPYPLGTTAVTLTATDTETLTSTCNASVTVVDKQPPTISSVSASPNVLWPPNNTMVPVTVSVSASDNCDTSPVCKITGITSNESISSSDAQITGNLTASLRAERLGSGAGRTYTLAIQCTDASGNSSTANATVSVPHDQGS
jgi:hypothetical protein